MGNWTAYSLVVGPGERNPQQVAAELRATLPAHVEAILGDSDDVARVVGPDGPDVWVADELVHWATGQVHAPVTQFEDLLVALEVRARWACEAWLHEAGYEGYTRVHAWIDGAYRLVDRQHGETNRSGADAVQYVEREWGLTGWVGRKPERTSASYDPVDSPGDPAPRAPVGLERPDAVDGETPTDRLLDALDDGPGRRRAAIEELYRRAADGEALPLAPLADHLDDEVTGLVAGATLRELDPGTGELAELLDSDDPGQRHAAARYCVLAPLVDPPTASLADGLDDHDRRVRAAVATAFGYGTTNWLSYDVPEGLVARLAGVAGDADPQVAVDAAIAASRVVRQRDGDEPLAAVEALVAVATADDPVARQQAADYVLGTGTRLFRETPEPARPALLVGLIEAADNEAFADATDLVGDAADRFPEAVEPVLTDLVALGWQDESELARDVVVTAAERHEFTPPVGPLAAALAEGNAVTDAVAALDAVGALERALSRSPGASARAVKALSLDVQAGRPAACRALERLANVDTTIAPAALDALGTALADTPSVAPARSVASLLAGEIDVPDAVVADAADTLRVGLGAPDPDDRRAAGAALAQVASLAPEAVSGADSIREASLAEATEPLVALAAVDPGLSADPIRSLCRVVTESDGHTHDVVTTLEAIADEAPAALATVAPTLATVLDVVGGNYRPRFAAVLRTAVEADPRPLADDPVATGGLARHLLALRGDVRTNVAHTLVTVAEAGGSVPSIARGLGDADPGDPGWPLVTVAANAPAALDRAVETALAGAVGDGAPESGRLLAVVARVDPDRFRSRYGPFDRLAERLDGPDAEWVVRAIAAFATERPALLPEKTVSALAAHLATDGSAQQDTASALLAVARERPDQLSEATISALAASLAAGGSGVEATTRALLETARERPTAVEAALAVRLEAIRDLLDAPYHSAEDDLTELLETVGLTDETDR